jgi:hypothetical protein
MVREGTDKLTLGHGLALQKPRSSDMKYFTWLHFEPYLHYLSALIFHFSSKNELTCQYRPKGIPYPCNGKSCHLLAGRSTWAATKFYNVPLLNHPKTRAISRARTLHNLPEILPWSCPECEVWLARGKSPRSFDELLARCYRELPKILLQTSGESRWRL